MSSGTVESLCQRLGEEAELVEAGRATMKEALAGLRGAEWDSLSVEEIRELCSKVRLVPLASRQTWAALLERLLQGKGALARAYASMAVASTLLWPAGESEQASQREEQARAVFQRHGDEFGEAWALSDLAVALANLGRTCQVVEVSGLAVEVARRIGAWYWEAGALEALASAYSQTGQHSEALRCARRALRLRAKSGSRKGQYSSLRWLGMVYRRMGSPLRAWRVVREALAAARELGDRWAEADTLEELFGLAKGLGKFGPAREFLQQALAIDAEVGYLGQRHVVRLLNMTDLLMHAGEREPALRYAGKAVELARGQGLREVEALALKLLAGAYSGLARHKEALECCEAGLALARASGAAELEARILYKVAYVYHASGQHGKAIKFLSEHWHSLEASGSPSLLGDAFHLLGSCQERSGRAEEAAESYRRSVDFYTPGVHGGWTRPLARLGKWFVLQGCAGEGFARLREALRASKKIEPGSEPYFLGMLGEAEEEAHRPERAYQCYLRAVKTVERQRAGLTVGEHRLGCWEDWVGYYHRAVGCAVALGRNRQALEHAERARARTLVELIAAGGLPRPTGADTALGPEGAAAHQRVEELRGDLQALHNRGDHLSLEANSPGIRAARVSVNQDIKQAEGAYEKALEELRRQNPELYSLTDVDVLTLKQIREEVLDRETALLEYFVTAGQVIAFALSKRRGLFSTKAIPLDGTSLEQLVARCLPSWRLDGARRQWLLGQVHQEHLREAYRLLVAPVESDLQGFQRLVVVPHGPLHRLPFHALTAEDGTSLADQYPLGIAYAPSATALSYCQSPTKRHGPPSTALVLANPRCRQAALPGAELEGLQVARLFHPNGRLLSGAEATRESLRSLASDMDLIHLSCHGHYAEYNPLFSGLILAGGNGKGKGRAHPRDDLVTVHDLFGLRLQASLVTLSGCVTGRSAAGAGDELIGLSRGFFCAGTPSLLTSLWEVNDFSTALLMRSFYTRWMKGADKAAALKHAQEEVRTLRAGDAAELLAEMGSGLEDGGGRGKGRKLRQLIQQEIERLRSMPPSERAYSAPYYWAPFILMGDWN